jgi:hypothetical protein
LSEDGRWHLSETGASPVNVSAAIRFGARINNEFGGQGDEMTSLMTAALAFVCFAATATTQARAQERDKLKHEYTRFAQLYSMDWGSPILLDVRMRGAPKRAEMLQAERFTDPTLRKAVELFQPLAKGYFAIWEYKKNKRLEWASFERGLKTWEAVKNGGDLGFVSELLKARGEENKYRDELNYAFIINVLHGEDWKTILPIAKQLAGPQANDFPLRLGVTYLHNTSRQTLTNVTVAIETNSWVERPGPGRTHVLFFERIEPGEWVSFPAWLVNKRWNGKSYTAGTDTLKCSVYSDQSYVEDVSFDMKKVQGSGFGLIPNKSFTGSYDTKTPWNRLPIAPKKLSLTVEGGSWRGDKRMLLIADSIGSYFTGVDTDIATRSSRVIEGSIRDGKIEWVPLYADRGELGQPHWGTIKDGVMELNYGKDGKADGSVTLKFAKKKK